MTQARTKTQLIAVIVASAFFMQQLDSSIINTSLPQMALSFGVEPIDLSLGITAYILSTAAFLPVSGWAADRYGAKHVFAAAIIVFTLASLACGLSQNLWQFTGARVVQGIGGALMAPVGRMVVLRNTEKSELLQATALITWPGLLAPIVGPLVGGWITTYADWRWNFLLNIPLGLAGLALVLTFVPNHREAVRRPLDRLGFVLSSAGLVCLLYGLESLSHIGVSWGSSATFVGAGILFGALAVRHFGRRQHPLLDLSSLKVRTFYLSTLSGGFVLRMVIAATPFLLPLLFQIGFGLNAWTAGLYVLAYFIGNLAMKTVTTPALRRYGFRKVLVVNSLVASLAVAACGLLAPHTPIALIVAVLLIAGLSRSMEFTALNTLAFADVAAHQRGSSSTLNSMTQQISMGLGVALGAFLLNASEALRHAAQVELVDLKLAFVVVGAIGVLGTLTFLRLPHDAGAEVSGHRALGRREPAPAQ